MKIAFLLDTYPSLTESFIARDIAALRRRGLSIEIFALHPGEGARPLRVPGAALALLDVGSKLLRQAAPRSHGGERAAYFKALGAAWWRHLHSSGGAEGITQIHAGWASHPASIAWGAAQESGLPWSFSGHARDVFVEGGDLRGKVEAARGAAVCTRAAQRFLCDLSGAGTEKIIYAPHGIDVENFACAPPQLRALETPLRLLAVGRLVEKKGFAVLLDALAVLRARGVDFHTEIIGDGPQRDVLTARRDRLNLKDFVHFSGALPQSEVIAAMRRAHCFVAPSIVAADGDRDGLPNVLLEAAACGLPLIATRAGAIEEFIDAETGLLCPPGRAEALADAVGELLAAPDVALQRCHAARLRVERDFDSFANSAKLAALFGRSV